MLSTWLRAQYRAVCRCRRWKKLNTDVHKAAYLLDPENLRPGQTRPTACEDALQRVLKRLARSAGERSLLLKQRADFLDK